MPTPKKYRATLTRVHARLIWISVQNTKAENRTHDDWLAAANRELLPSAGVTIRPGARLVAEAIEKPEEKITLIFSFEALCGIKHAIVQQAKAMPFREREDILEAMEGFGSEFAAKVRHLCRRPESDDLDSEKELEGVPTVETKLEIVKEAPNAEA